MNENVVNKVEDALQTTAGLASADLDAFWMPFSGNREFKRNPRLITGAQGCYYTAADGRRILDSLSGLWCSSFGHGRAEITEAITDAARALDYAPPFQFGHPGAFQLANRLRGLTPEGLDHAFFVNSGSEAVDTALKMARAYWRARQRPEKSFLIGRAKGYHGVNVGGTSIGGIGANRGPFGPLLEVGHLSHTLLADNAYCRGMPDRGAELADELEQMVELHGAANIAAVMVEPMSGSAGVIVPPQGYLQRLKAICQRHDILLIFDEVLTGFGRLGASFGAELFGVTPDIMTLAKNLTNGTVPMGAVMTSHEIYQTLMDDGGQEHLIEFAHGYTYSAHPLACAAGNAALDLYQREALAGRAASLAPYFEAQLHSLKGRPGIVDIRNLGLAGAIQFEPTPDSPLRRPWRISMECWKRGMYLRYGGDTVQLGPPFIAGKAHIDEIFNILSDAITAAA